MVEAKKFKEIVISRLIEARPQVVFDAWIEPEQLVQWFYATEGWSTPFAEIDARAGGKFRIGFKSPGGKESFNFEGVYTEVLPPGDEEPGRIMFTIADGRPVTVTFEEQESDTLLTLTLALETVNSEEVQRNGWSGMLTHLTQHLEKFS